MEEVNPEKEIEMRQIGSEEDKRFSDTTQDETSFIEESTKQLFNSVREIAENDFIDPFDDMMRTEIGPDDYGLLPYDPEYRPTVTGPSDERTEAIRRKLIYRDCDDFFSNILDLEPQCSQPEFIDHMVNRGIIDISRTFSKDLVSEYKVRYLGSEYNTTGRVIDNNEQIRNGIRLYYDEWKKEELNKTMKKAGVITAVGLAIIALVTGLSVGLTRTGADIVHQAKLHPSKKIKPGEVIPWTALEKAGGKVIIFAGEYLVVIGVTGAWLLLRRR